MNKLDGVWDGVDGMESSHGTVIMGVRLEE